MTILTILVGVLFLCWFVLSITGQFSIARLAAINRADLFSLIPRWTFFAPNPGTSDYNLLYREKYEGGGFSHFKEIPLTSPRSLRNALWNPEKRNQKALSDSVHTLIRLAYKMKIYGLKTTIPYIAIINYLSSLDHPPMVSATQFMIIESFGYYTEEEPRVIMTSEFHSV